MNQLRFWQEEILQTNIEKGFRGPSGEARTTFGEAMALLHSEVSEALEAWRSWGISDQTEPGGKPEGVGSEFADIMIRLLDSCDMFGVDLTAEVKRKLAYNRTRAYRHGKKML